MQQPQARKAKRNNTKYHLIALKHALRTLDTHRCDLSARNAVIGWAELFCCTHSAVFPEPQEDGPLSASAKMFQIGAICAKRT